MSKQSGTAYVTSLATILGEVTARQTVSLMRIAPVPAALQHCSLKQISARPLRRHCSIAAMTPPVSYISAQQLADKLKGYS